MYTLLLMTAMSGGGDVASFGGLRGGCHGATVGCSCQGTTVGYSCHGGHLGSGCHGAFTGSGCHGAAYDPCSCHGSRHGILGGWLHGRGTSCHGSSCYGSVAPSCCDVPAVPAAPGVTPGATPMPAPKAPGGATPATPSRTKPETE